MYPCSLAYLQPKPIYCLFTVRQAKEKILNLNCKNFLSPPKILTLQLSKILKNLDQDMTYWKLAKNLDFIQILLITFEQKLIINIKFLYQMIKIKFANSNWPSRCSQNSLYNTRFGYTWKMVILTNIFSLL